MAMNIGRMFFGGLTFGEDRKATFNEVVFEINSEGTHFNASSLFDQCGKILGRVSKKGTSSKFWADFIRIQDGNLPEGSHKEINGVHWVEYKYLLPVLSYSMTTSIRVNSFLCGEKWTDRNGYVYLVMVMQGEKILLKFGRTWDMDARMNWYRGKYDKFSPIISCKVNDMYEAEKYLGEYLFSHGAEQHGGDKSEWFTFSSPKDSSRYMLRGIRLWTNGLIEYDPEVEKDLDVMFLKQTCNRGRVLGSILGEDS